MTNIPIFRGKKIDGDEYVIGYLLPSLLRNSEFLRIMSENGNIYFLHQSTLSIHFSDMLASDSDRLLPNGEKDLRIFASLSNDGKGGDLVEVYEKERILANYTVKWSRCGTNALCFDVGTRTTKKILGIQQ